MAPSKKKVRVEIKVYQSGAKRPKRRLNAYQHFTKNFIMRTGGSFADAAAAWRAVKKQADAKGVSVNDIEINFT